MIHVHTALLRVHTNMFKARFLSSTDQSKTRVHTSSVTTHDHTYRKRKQAIKMDPYQAMDESAVQNAGQDLSVYLKTMSRMLEDGGNLEYFQTWGGEPGPVKVLDGLTFTLLKHAKQAYTSTSYY